MLFRLAGRTAAAVVSELKVDEGIRFVRGK